MERSNNRGILAQKREKNEAFYKRLVRSCNMRHGFRIVDGLIPYL
jgi:hypothetical protein